MHELLGFTKFLNSFLAGPVNALLGALKIHPHDPANPINDPTALQLLVFLLLIVVFLLVRASLSVDRPGVLQTIFEGLEGFVKGQSEEIIGHHSERYTPYLVTLGVFVLSCNLIGLVPGLMSPTYFPVVPLGCALVTWFYYHFQGFRKQGVGHYLLHFAGPVPLLAPLMIPIEIFSHIARVISLTIRLYANIFAGDMVTLVFFSLIPIGIPVAFLGLHVGVSFIQAYLFVLLATVYLQGAVAEEH